MSKVDNTKCNDIQKPSPKYGKNKKTFETCCKKHTSKQGLSHCGLAIYIRTNLEVKEELWKFKYFIMQTYNFQKIL
jgi:hypothetical protein